MDVTKTTNEFFRSMAQGWAIDLTIAILFPLFIFACLYIAGREDLAITPKRRRYFVIPAFIAAYLVSHLVSAGFRQLNEIKRSVSGGGNADFVTELTDNPAIGTSQKDGNTGVIFWMNVINRGGKSVVRKWRCKVQLIGGATLISDSSAFSAQQIALKISDTGETRNHSLTNHLPTLLLENALDNGAGKAGWLAFSFAGVSTEEITRPGVIFTLEVEDTRGNKTLLPWIVPVGYSKRQP